MTITKTRTFHEFLVRGDADGKVQGAHIGYLETVAEDGVILAQKTDGPSPVSVTEGVPAEVLAVIQSAALDTVAAHEATIAELRTAKNAAEAQVADLTAQLAAIKPAEVNGVPQSVTRFQALAVLDADGLLDRVTAIMSAPETPRIAKLAWDNAQSFDRDSPTIGALAGVLGLTGPMLDDLFIAASKIKA